MANRLPAPGWQRPHVAARFFAWIVERGSDDGRMLCTPWQLAQLATVCEPAFAAMPWNDASKLTSRSAGNPNLRARRTSPWQAPQVSRIFWPFTGEAALLGGRMECSPWQSVHTGACKMPRATALPCTLAWYAVATSVWHMPQVSGTAARNVDDWVLFS